jgi:hypothetical protein
MGVLEMDGRWIDEKGKGWKGWKGAVVLLNNMFIIHHYQGLEPRISPGQYG